MKLFDSLFNKLTNPHDFTPDFTLPEYDNYLNFISEGGNGKQWDLLKVNNKWVFPERMIKKAGRTPTKQEHTLIDATSAKYPSKANKSEQTGRRAIPAETIDRMQKIEASPEYCKAIYDLYYSGYPEMPFISQDRELNTDWIDMAAKFKKQCIIPKSMMQRFSDGLLPGHVYMLYWLGKYTNKKVPAYFEYKYGVDFEKEKAFLACNGYLDETSKPTKKGKKAIEKHFEIIAAY